MAEGRVRNEGGGFGLSLKMEYFITDHQGNTRVSFEDDGTNTNTVKLTQENSYYAFGMQMAGGYTPTSNPNKKLYNAGSEWQDDIEGLADYYSTFFREYDPIIGRFNGVDPMAEATDAITTYAYANNNPVMMNDPMGNEATLAQQMGADYKDWHGSQYGWDNRGGWGFDFDGGGGGGIGSYNYFKAHLDYLGSPEWKREMNAKNAVGGGIRTFSSDAEAFEWGVSYMDEYNMWGNNGSASSLGAAKNAYKGTDEGVWLAQRTIIITGSIKTGTWKTSRVFDISAGAITEINLGDNVPWMTSARNQLGQSEIPGNAHNPAIIGYHATTGKFKKDEIPWCSSFVNWSIMQAGIKGTNNAMAYSWKTWGQELHNPAYGAIAIMNYSHVGFVAGINDDGRIILLGGNQGSPGSVNLSPNSRSSVITFRYPDGYIPNYNLPSYKLRGRSLTLSSTR